MTVNLQLHKYNRQPSKLINHNTHTHTTVLRLCGFCPGQPAWAGTRRNIDPVTLIVVINNPYLLSPSTTIHGILLNHNINKLEALRENKPPPNTAWHKSVCNFLSNPEDPDFGLWTPGSEAWSGSPPKLYTWSLSHALPLQKNSPKSVHKFASNPTDRQTDRQTERQTDRTKNITSFFGGGKEFCLTMWSVSTCCFGP